MSASDGGDPRAVWIDEGDGWVLASARPAGEGAPIEARFADGSRRLVRAAAVRRWTELAIDGATAGRRLAAHAADVEAFLDEARRQLAELWSVLSAEAAAPGPATWRVEEMAGFLADPAQAAWYDAVCQAILVDDIYFKRRDDRFEVLDARVVVERRRQAEGRQRADDRRVARVEVLKEAMASRLRADRSADPVLADAVELLEVVAAHDGDHPRGAEAMGLVSDALSPRPDRVQQDAFDALVALGVYGPHENLLARRHDLVRDFPAAVLAEAAELAAAPLDERAPRFEGFAVAIDDAETRDVDDALAVEQVGGAWVIHILIADVAGRVPLDGAVAAEARRRGGSVYLPDGVLPMLPPALSEGALSLVEGQERAALDLRVALTPEGRPYAIRVLPVRLVVAQQLTYDEADAIIHAGEPAATPSSATLATLDRLTRQLRADRVQHGAVPWQPDDYKVRAAPDGSARVTPIPTDSPSRRLVSECMILAGAMVGRHCSEQGIPVVYRAQDGGSDDPAPAADAQRPGLADIFASLRGRRPAELRMSPAPHRGLGVDAYVQVTSPIRRYQDYVGHVQLRSFAALGFARLTPRQVMEVTAEVDQIQPLHRQVMRSADTYWILRHYEARVGQVVEAEVVGQVGDRLRIFLLDSGHQVVWSPLGRPAIGERIRVEVAAADARRGRLILRAPG